MVSGQSFELIMDVRNGRRIKVSGFILRIWPAKRSLHLTTVTTRWNFELDAASHRPFPVMWGRQPPLNPFRKVSCSTGVTKVGAYGGFVEMNLHRSISRPTMV